MINSAGFLERHTQFRRLLGRHPGLVPLLQRDRQAAAEIRSSAAHNQAARVTLRDGRPGYPYDPVSKQEESFRSPYRPAENSGAADSDPKAESRKYSVPYFHSRQRELQQILARLEDRAYLNEQQEVRDTITDRRELRTEIHTPRIEDHQKLRRYLAESAHRQAGSPLHPDLVELRENPELAAWIASDRADISGLMQEHGTETARDKATDSWSYLRTRIAEKAAGWFDESSPLDKAFFEQYPTAAYYLSENPRLLEDLQKQDSTAGKFVARFERIHQRLLPGLAELAAQRADSPGQFNQRWFAHHQEQAILVETGRRVLPDESLETAFSGQPRQPEYSDRELAGNWEHAIAADGLEGAELPEKWVEEQLWLSKLINRAGGFADRVISIAARVKEELEREDNPEDDSWWAVRLANALDIDLPAYRYDRRV